MSPCISNYFSDIEDPRINRKKLHSLSDILILTISAMFSGADGYEAIEEFGRNKTCHNKTRKGQDLQKTLPSKALTARPTGA